MTQLTGFTRDRDGAFIVKDPDSYLDYSVDWSDWLDDSDDIATSTWTIETITGDTAPLTTDANSKANGITTIWLDGGTAGNNYRVTNTITTDNGLTDERYFRIFVKNRTVL